MSKDTKKTQKPAKNTKPASKTSGKGSRKSAKSTLSLKQMVESDGDRITRREYITFGISSFLFILSAFVTLSILSFAVTGNADMQGMQQASSNYHITNWMGSLGYSVANFLVQQKFGFASLVFPVFLVVSGIRIMNIWYINLWKWFLHSVYLLILFSLVGACMGSLLGSILPGGTLGAEAMNYLQQQVGPFRYIVIIVLAAIYLCYVSTRAYLMMRHAVEKPAEMVREARERRMASALERQNAELTANVAEDDGTEAPDPVATITLDDEATAPQPTRKSPQKKKDPETMEWEFRGNAYTEHQEEQKKGQRTATTIDFTPDAAQPTEAEIQPNLQEEFTVTAGGEETQREQDPLLGGAGFYETHSIEVPVDVDPETGEVLSTTNITVNMGQEVEKAELTQEGALEPYDPKLDLQHYHYPTLDLLKHYEVSNAIDMEEQNKNKNQILRALSNFGVEISSIKATVGPTITLYEITPAPGVRISKIRNLEDDIALSLSALGIRIIAPIPGKGTIGIEVPNAKPQMVSMESIINSRKFQETDFELPMALGKTITNDVYMVDLAKMPHLLVAGATGQGKSVGLNAIITSLLYKKHPAELKLVMVDPKKVEFSVYSPIINHFLAQVEGNEDTEEPIITDVSKVIQTLKSLCVEMDTRYDLLKKARTRNVKEYNDKFKARQLNPNNGHKFMPYIVVIIDEFGDLIMTAGKEIELPIARIAQLARAVGIHMIIATQRPTTNIITGTIKANFPARMAFKVSAVVDSRTILDRPGANQLVGKGDMLFLSGSEPVRVQCAFVDTPEVEKITNHIACQESYTGPFPLPHVEMEGADEGGAADVDMNHLDPMFEEVARLIVSTQQGSTSMIQRKFSIGYNRAGRLMDQMEKAGIVGPAHGSKPREVLVMGDVELDQLLMNLR